ncbi:hypothetical protein BLNAU_878 [Blattamonas nauphoetae]|uniref:Uncharacterized protein n=1 Tax=Blattamonas nauphoetae TaxID=2049346 RepID=A0ABQ9YKS3_9EUKA|nr:hypothetical protein BLNAU_878 [Blattamonas nauphoetae]
MFYTISELPELCEALLESKDDRTLKTALSSADQLAKGGYFNAIVPDDLICGLVRVLTLKGPTVTPMVHDCLNILVECIKNHDGLKSFLENNGCAPLLAILKSSSTISIHSEKHEAFPYSGCQIIVSIFCDNPSNEIRQMFLPHLLTLFQTSYLTRPRVASAIAFIFLNIVRVVNGAVDFSDHDGIKTILLPLHVYETDPRDRPNLLTTIELSAMIIGKLGGLNHTITSLLSSNAISLLISLPRMASLHSPEEKARMGRAAVLGLFPILGNEHASPKVVAQLDGELLQNLFDYGLSLRPTITGVPEAVSSITRRIGELYTGDPSSSLCGQALAKSCVDALLKYSMNDDEVEYLLSSLLVFLTLFEDALPALIHPNTAPFISRTINYYLEKEPTELVQSNIRNLALCLNNCIICEENVCMMFSSDVIDHIRNLLGFYARLNSSIFVPISQLLLRVAETPVGVEQLRKTKMTGPLNDLYSYFTKHNKTDPNSQTIAASVYTTLGRLA